MAGEHTNRGAKRARQAREDLGLGPHGPVDDVLALAEERAGLWVFVLDLPPGVAGAYSRRDAQGIAFVAGAMAPVRRRFTLAHELGHHRIGHDGALPVDTFGTLAGQTGDGFEIEANAFAAELLMPKADFAGAPEPDLDLVVRRAAEYGVSAIAMLLRFWTADRVSRERYVRLRAEIDSDLHLVLAGALGLEERGDAIALAEAPRVPPGAEGGALGALRRGETELHAVAMQAAADPDVLRRACEGFGL